jgi:SAM-dependent methyltransferase
MLLPDTGPFESIRVRWDGNEAAGVAGIARPDVSNALADIPGAGESGFAARIAIAFDHTRHVELVGFKDGRPRARLASFVRPPSLDSAPLPPEQLAERVSAVSGAAFRTQGLKGITDLVEQVERHTELSSESRVLDWGCGCGRLTRHLVDAGFERVLGCDIDAEAIEWCARNLAPATFTVSPRDPPLPYEDASIDLVIGCSVFTHLSREDQRRWLVELHRVLAPGGVLLASVNGEFMFARVSQARSRFPVGAIRGRVRRMRRAASLGRHGIVDAEVDHRLDGVAPSGYYRATYQTREYTIREWSGRLDVLEYVERGLMGHQDLVVMRRPPD